jgi:hypothetical protein|tara:strand:+ start:398 stop:511 length:114 start_codon:yes stop_codon:yes gene_type:complete
MLPTTWATEAVYMPALADLSTPKVRKPNIFSKTFIYQ